jgi:hypothetical protein
MFIRKAANITEIKTCVDLYYRANDNSIMPACYDKSLRNLTAVWRQGAFYRVIEIDDQIVGWFLAGPNDMGFVRDIVFQQSFYYSNLSGFKAARAIRLAHSAIRDEAERLGLSICVSACSHEDTEKVMCRLLEKDGWIIKGHLAVYHTKHFKQS